MSKITETFSMRLPISEARAACENAIGGLGWRIDSAEVDQFEITRAPGIWRNYQRISIAVQPDSTNRTTIVLNGKIGGYGPVQKRYLSSSISLLREAIAQQSGESLPA